MRPSVHVEITDQEHELLDLLRREPKLVENLRHCTAPMEHQRSMLKRLHMKLILASGAQRTAAAKQQK